MLAYALLALLVLALHLIPPLLAAWHRGWLYHGSAKALLRLHEGSIKALYGPQSITPPPGIGAGSMKVLALRLY